MKTILTAFTAILAAGQTSAAGLTETITATLPEPYNVIWDSPSRNSSESMPCGGGDIGLNVWVEEGDVLFYMQRSGSLAEQNEYLKLGRVRLRLDPNPFAAPDADFRQEFKLPRKCS